MRAPCSLCDTGLLLLVIAVYPTTVLAADIVLGELTIPLIKFGYVLMMALWGALAALLQRFARGEEIATWKIVAMRDLTNASLASILTFLACEQFKVPPALAAIAYTLAGYGGARFMEFIYRRFLYQIKSAVGENADARKP